MLKGIIGIPIGIPGILEAGQAYLGSHRNTCRNRLGKHTWAAIGILVGTTGTPLSIPGNLEAAQAYLSSHRTTYRNNRNTYRNVWKLRGWASIPGQPQEYL